MNVNTSNMKLDRLIPLYQEIDDERTPDLIGRRFDQLSVELQMTAERLIRRRKVWIDDGVIKYERRTARNRHTNMEAAK